jgi:hypothetical protein
LANEVSVGVELLVLGIAKASPYATNEGRGHQKIEMPKTARKWFLFQYFDGVLMPLSRPFKSKELAEKARSKYSE